jgi:hypothetical protein
MGKVRIVGDVSSKEYQLLEETGSEFKVKNASDAKDILKADSTTITDASGVKLNAHASRHASGGADAIGTNALRIAQVGLVLGTGTTVNVDAGSYYVLPKGIYYVFLGTNTRVEAYDDIAAAWKVVIAAGGNGIAISDGTNARLYNAGASAEGSNLRAFA